MANMISIPKEIQALADELQLLRRKLENETSIATKLRDAYDSECRRVPVEALKLVAAKLRFDAAIAGIDRIKAEIAERERAFDEAQGREAEESRRRQAQADLERANQRLAESQNELRRLRAEFAAFPDKIRIAESHFNEALRGINDARKKADELLQS